MITWSPSRLCLISRHIRHSVPTYSQLISLDLLPDLNQPVVEELQCPARLQPEHLLQSHALLHAHLNRVDADQPDHLLVAWRDGRGTDVEGVVPVVGVVPEADFVFLQEEGVVEVEVTGQGLEVYTFSGGVEVVDPFVSVADFEKNAET